MIARVLPFAAYMAFIALTAGISWLSGAGLLSPAWVERADLWLYPFKTAVVLSLIVFFWPRLDELKGKPFGGAGDIALSVAVGVAVYLAWVRMDWSWALQGQAAGYDPFKAGETAGLVLAGARIFGAAAVVPVMEELFWRSFLIRYLVSPRFESIRLGTFTPLSFGATVVLFGLEHHLWLAGMMAGLSYNLLLYRTGRLWPCITAHAVTNLALAAHVLVTGEWKWW